MFLRLSVSIRQICRFVAVLLAAAAFAAGGSARAQAPGPMPFPLPLLSAGDAVVTGFSGVTPPAVPPPPGVNPLDLTFINLDGTSMQIERLQPNGPPAGQLIPSPAIFSALARDVGQVMPITIDDALTPNIYLGASSVFGLNIVAPDPTGALKRIKLGQPAAKWMDGQWGTAKGGTAGSIYKVDGATGAITLFTTIGANAGPGLGDVVFDKSSHQFLVSDLDTGLIYRLDSTGLIVDTFDHGVAGRPMHALAAVADDGSQMNIANPAFNSENPATWGYTQKERRVWGMAVYSGRLYYAVADAIPQVWSIGIQLDGKFAGDPRWELDVAGLASNNAVTDMVFDKEGRMILAQRGPQRGSYDYSVFAEPLTSSVVRYTREVPDNPATPGTWIPAPEQYAIGFPPDRHNADGGVALGYRYDANGYMRTGSCGEFLWSTGTALRDDPALAAQLAAGGPAIVDGLQGNDRNLVRPANDPPFQSYFTDYDGAFDHPEHKGWMGDVEILQPCQGGYYTPPFFPPGYTPPPTGTFDLKLDKEASPKTCLPSLTDWLCYYTVRVTNVGSTIYWGPLSVHDWLPGNPAGATMTFDFQPPWNCNALGPTDYQCDLAAVLLFPGDSVDLYVTVKLPIASDLCYLDNAAQIVWWPGYGDQNPANDIDFAQAQIPNPKCQPPQGPRTNLKIEKRALTDTCLLNAPIWTCIFDIIVTNTGPGIYNGPIVVNDTVSAPAAVTDWALKPNPPDWTCAPVPGAAVSCTHAPVILNPGQNVHLWVRVDVPVIAQADAGKCTVQNEAKIVQAPGGSNQNTNPADDTASAEAKTPGRNCEPVDGGKSDLSIRKVPRGCDIVQFAAGSGYLCYFGIVVKNEGPASFAGPLTIHDVYTPGGPAAFGPPGAWTCVGGAGTYDCTLNPGFLPMAPGAVRVLTMTTFVPQNAEVCKVDNTASISNPPGGSDANTNPANDSASATDDIPSDRCRPPRQSNLKIEKTAGACSAPTTPTPGAAAAVVPGVVIECLFDVKVSNTGPDTYNGNLGWFDSAGPGTATQITPPAGWFCAPPGQLTGCGYVNISLANGASASFTVRVRTTQARAQANQCMVRNGAAIFFPLGFPSNTIAADDVAFAAAAVPANLCQSVLRQEIQACPTNRQMPGGTGCCPEGQVWNGKACSGGAAPPPPPPPPPGKCPSDSTGTPPNCTCKAGSHGVAGQCLPNVCPPGTTGTYPNCTTPPAECPPGWTGKPPNCKPPTTQACPADSTGVYPRCVCKQGTHGTPGACQPNVCPPGTVGTYPNCVTPKCPTGTVGTYPNCTTVQLCPSDSVGTFPNCRCKPGTSGTPGACKPNVCPPGTTGVWPNCTTPPACPSDSHGIYPRCVCNSGTTGTPGKCVKTPSILNVNPGVIQKLPCPSGTTGTPPNCIPVPR